MQKAWNKKRTTVIKMKEKHLITLSVYLLLQVLINRNGHWRLMMTDYRSCQITFGKRGRERKHNMHTTEKAAICSDSEVALKYAHIQTLKRFTKLVNVKHGFTGIQMLTSKLSKQPLQSHAAWQKQKHISTPAFTPPLFTRLHSETCTARQWDVHCASIVPFVRWQILSINSILLTHHFKGITLIEGRKVHSRQ